MQRISVKSHEVSFALKAKSDVSYLKSTVSKEHFTLAETSVEVSEAKFVALNMIVTVSDEMKSISYKKSQSSNRMSDASKIKKPITKMKSLIL